MYTAEIIATGFDSQYPGGPGAVAAIITYNRNATTSAEIGEVTLRTDPQHGDLTTWGTIHHWADPRVIAWLNEHPEDEYALIESVLVAHDEHMRALFDE